MSPFQEMCKELGCSTDALFAVEGDILIKDGSLVQISIDDGSEYPLFTLVIGFLTDYGKQLEYSHISIDLHKLTLYKEGDK